MESEKIRELIKEIVAEVIAQLPQGYGAGCRVVEVKGDLFGNILQGDNSQFVGSGAILNGNDVRGSINVNASGSVVNSGNGSGRGNNTSITASGSDLQAENKRLREEVERLRGEFERLR